ncbi:MAG: hypothetical protein HQ474_08810 [Flammeovirgaceae bacterium]|nr:hypothetical protein [Flammeovirgaceae bacterium]
MTHSRVPVIAAFLGVILGILTQLINDFVSFIEGFPWSIWGDLYLSATQVIFLYLVVIFLMISIKYRSFNS